MGRKRRCSGRILGQNTAVGLHLPIQLPGGFGVDHVRAAAQNADHGSVAQKGAFGCRGVDPGGKAGHGDAAASGRLIAQSLGGELAVGAGLAGAHQGERGPLAKLRQPPLVVEHHRRIGDLPQDLRIALVVPAQDRDAQPEAGVPDRGGLCKLFVGKQLRLGRGQTGAQKLHLARVKQILRGSETL